MRATSTVASALVVRAGQPASEFAAQGAGLRLDDDQRDERRPIDVDEKLAVATLAHGRRLRVALHLERRGGRRARTKVDRLDEQEIFSRVGHGDVVERERENSSAG